MPARAHGPKRRGAPTRGLALIGLFALSACGTEPAYQLSWKLTDDLSMLDSADELTQVSQCSTVGVARVRVTTMAEDAIYDVREYPCFHDGPVDGPSLEEVPPGDYELEFVGLRRTGEPWACPSLTPKPNDGEPEGEPDPNEEGSGDAPCVARGHASLTVREGDLPLAEVALLAPPECDDGIDNDGDGKVDGKDPACLLDASLDEADDAGVVIFDLSATFLGGTVVEPPDVEVARLRVEIDGELFAEVSSSELATSADSFELPTLTRRFSEAAEPSECDEPEMAGEPHELTITGLDLDGQPRTQALSYGFCVNPEQFNFKQYEAAFTEDTFLEPLIYPYSFSWGVTLDASLGLDADQCDPDGLLEFDRLAVTSLDGQGQPLDFVDANFLRTQSRPFGVPTDLTGVTNEGGGTLSFDCNNAALKSLLLEWGSYQVKLEARVGDTVCFETPEAIPLPPFAASAENIIMPRKFEDGLPPPGCEDCINDEDCEDLANRVCQEGMCVAKASP